jgi:methyl-accepting chemotaxis protein
MKNIKIKYKIYIFTLVPLIVLATVILSSSITKIKSSLLSQNYDKLKTARDIKKNQLEKLLKRTRLNIESLANTRTIKSFVLELGNLDDYEDLEISEKKKFPIDDPNIQKMAQRQDDNFKTYVSSYSVSDIYLVSIDYGQIVYSTMKNSEYGENLIHGKLKNSHLAKLYDKVKKTKTTSFSDLKNYSPLQTPSMFIATPVIIDNTLESILVMRINNDLINEIIYFKEGYGQTQEDYLVGNDYILRSNTTLSADKFNIKNSMNKIQTESVKNAIDNKSETIITKNYKDISVLSAYTSIKIEDDIQWNIISEISEDEILKLPNSIQYEVFTITLIILIIIISIISILTTKYLVRPIENLKGTLKALSKFSSADQRINIDTKDEIGQLADIFNNYLEKSRKNKVEEQQIVEECEKAIQMIRCGFFEYKITASSSNRTTNDLKNSINILVDDLNEKFSIIKLALIEYGKGNFQYSFRVNNTSGTVGSIATATKTIGDNSSELLATIMHSGNFLQSNISQLSESVNQLSNSAQEQAIFLEKTSSSVQHISTNIKNNTTRIETLQQIDKKLVSKALEGQKLATQTEQSVNQLDQEINSITEAIKIIDQIAFQTNILSLNAAVEAATAGEAGKGFAVVAGEVRNLAGRSAEAAKDIKNLVDNANAKAASSKTIANEMLIGYKELENTIYQTEQIVADVSKSSIEDSKGINQINEAIQHLDDNTKNNAVETNNIKELSNQVNSLSLNLISIASNATFKENSMEQICDQNLLQDINSIKLKLLDFKDKTYNSMFGNNTSEYKSIDGEFNKWIIDMESKSAMFTNAQEWLHIKNHYKELKENLNIYIKTSHKLSDESQIELGNQIEKSIQRLFSLLDQIKRINCKKDKN